VRHEKDQMLFKKNNTNKKNKPNPTQTKLIKTHQKT